MDALYPAGISLNMVRNFSNIRNFRVRLARAQVDIRFSIDVSWNTLLQYDNVSDQLDLNTRLRWIIQPGREFFLVLNQSFQMDDFAFEQSRTEPVAKLLWTFRF